jgi:hypothetical protein
MLLTAVLSEEDKWFLQELAGEQGDEAQGRGA